MYAHTHTCTQISKKNPQISLCYHGYCLTHSPIKIKSCCCLFRVELGGESICGGNCEMVMDSGTTKYNGTKS